jgi:CBS domain-containing protein
MKVDQIMARNVKSCRKEDSLRSAAQLMWDNDCGILPVVDGDSRVVGVITDRDVCMGALFGNAPLGDLLVARSMSQDVCSCREQDPIELAESLMKQRQVRRLPVVDGEGRLTGMLSLNDIALECAHERDAASQPELQTQEISATLAAICAHGDRERSPLPLERLGRAAR